LVTFAKYIGQEFGRKGITAKIASPEPIKTDQNAHFPAEMKQEEYELIEAIDNNYLVMANNLTSALNHKNDNCN
jgi:hypothetical protein